MDTYKKDTAEGTVYGYSIECARCHRTEEGERYDTEPQPLTCMECQDQDQERRHNRYQCGDAPHCHREPVAMLTASVHGVLIIPPTPMCTVHWTYTMRTLTRGNPNTATSVTAYQPERINR